MTQVTKSRLSMSVNDWWYTPTPTTGNVFTSNTTWDNNMEKWSKAIDTAVEIENVCDSIKELLLQKNAAYGDSALNPANIFASGSAVENLACRIDDKLMRIKNRGLNDDTEDTVSDLIGYLVLLKIAMKRC